MSPDLRGSEAPKPATQASAREFLAVVFRRKWLVLGLFLITTLTALIVTLGTPTNFRSIGKVLVKRGERESLMLAYRTMTNWEEELASEVQFIESQPVVERAQTLLTADAKAAGRPSLRIHAEKVDAEVVGTSNAVLVAYTDRDPRIAETVCDALIRAYVARRMEMFNLTYPKQFFDSQIKQVADDLSHWEQLRRNYTTGSGTAGLEEQQRNSIVYRTVLDQRRNEIASDLAEARVSLNQMKALAADPNLDVPTTGQNNEAVLVDLKVKMMNQEARVAQLKEKYRDDSPDVLNAQATLEALRDLLRRESNARVAFAQSRVEQLEARLQPVESELRRVQTQLTAMPSQEMTLGEMDREIAVLRDRYSELVKNSDQAKVTQETSSGVHVMVLQPAGEAKPTNARDYVRLALAPAFSLVVGLGLAFFVDGLDNRVRDVGDAETATDLPVLASLRERRRRDDVDETPARGGGRR